MKLKIILFLTLFCSSILYSQTLINDSLICFTEKKAKFLAVQILKGKTYFLLDSICKEQLIIKDIEINVYNKIITNYEVIKENQEAVIKLKEVEVAALNNEIKKQKRIKYIAIITGAILNIILFYGR